MLQIPFQFGFGRRKVTSKCSSLTFQFYIGEIYYLMFQSIFMFEFPMGKIDKLQLYRGSLWPRSKYGKFSLNWTIPSHVLIWNGYWGNMPFFPQRKHTLCSLWATLSNLGRQPCPLCFVFGRIFAQRPQKKSLRMYKGAFWFLVFFNQKLLAGNIIGRMPT